MVFGKRLFYIFVTVPFWSIDYSWTAVITTVLGTRTFWVCRWSAEQTRNVIWRNRKTYKKFKNHTVTATTRARCFLNAIFYAASPFIRRKINANNLRLRICTFWCFFLRIFSIYNFIRILIFVVIWFQRTSKSQHFFFFLKCFPWNVNFLYTWKKNR